MEEFDIIDASGNGRLGRILEVAGSDISLQRLYDMANVMTMKRIGYPDHGAMHVAIVADRALRILRILNDAGVRPSVVKDHGFGMEDAEVVVLLASLFHDLGNAVHREEHEISGMILALPFIDKYLSTAGYDESKSMVLKAEILSAILSHSQDRIPAMTVESGVVRVADALDLEKGRAKFPFRSGTRDIHNISSMAVEKVEIFPRKEKPVEVRIELNNTAGIFLLDKVVRRKISASGLSHLIRLVAFVSHKGNIVDRFEL